MDKYKSGFTVNGKHEIETEEWLFDEKSSTENKLFFIGYDANLWPMPIWDEYDEKNKWHRKRKERCLEFTKGFEGEVYMDEVKIREVRKNEK